MRAKWPPEGAGAGRGAVLRDVCSAAGRIGPPAAAVTSGGPGRGGGGGGSWLWGAYGALWGGRAGGLGVRVRGGAGAGGRRQCTPVQEGPGSRGAVRGGCRGERRPARGCPEVGWRQRRVRGSRCPGSSAGEPGGAQEGCPAVGASGGVGGSRLCLGPVAGSRGSPLAVEGRRRCGGTSRVLAGVGEAAPLRVLGRAGGLGWVSCSVWGGVSGGQCGAEWSGVSGGDRWDLDGWPRQVFEGYRNQK